MHLTFLIIETLFGVAMFANACFFIPQAMKLYHLKDSTEVSLISFLGFLSIQFVVVLHGLIVQDRLLVYGTAISMLTCGSVVFLTIYYRLKRKSVDVLMD